jgi:glycine cleavage system H lipoate-binding protein
MVSPIEGIVTDITEAAMKDPEIVRNDPYGEGSRCQDQLPQSVGRRD